MSGNRIFLAKFFFGAAVFALLVGSLLFVLDPLGANYLFLRPGINEFKPAALHYERRFKPRRVMDVAPATLILGNSRGLMGMDPADAQELPRPVYNLSIENCQLVECRDLLRYSLDHAPVGHVVLLLDFNFFLNTSEAANSLEPRFWGNDPVSVLRRVGAGYLSSNAFAGIFETLTRNALRWPKAAVASSSGVYKIPEHPSLDTWSEERKLKAFDGWMGNDLGKIDAGLSLLDEMLALCRSRGVKAHVVLPPFPRAYFTVLEKKGWLEGFAHWKRELKRRTALVDLADPASCPPDGDFIDLVHFKPQVGARIFRILARGGV